MIGWMAKNNRVPRAVFQIRLYQVIAEQYLMVHILSDYEQEGRKGKCWKLYSFQSDVCLML